MTPLSDSQIYKPNEVQPPSIWFAIFLPYDNRMRGDLPETSKLLNKIKVFE